jgi:hypothetical protein
MHASTASSRERNLAGPRRAIARINVSSAKATAGLLTSYVLCRTRRGAVPTRTALYHRSHCLAGLSIAARGLRRGQLFVFSFFLLVSNATARARNASARLRIPSARSVSCDRLAIASAFSDCFLRDLTDLTMIPLPIWHFTTRVSYLFYNILLSAGIKLRRGQPVRVESPLSMPARPGAAHRTRPVAKSGISFRRKEMAFRQIIEDLNGWRLS